MAMVEDYLAADAPRDEEADCGLKLSLAAGGVTLVTGASADEIAAALEADPGPLRLGRLSEHAGGQGHLSAWACLAFGLTPFDLEPQASRLAAFAAEAGPAALAVERAERLTDAELVSLAGIASKAGFALLLLGGEELARRARQPALAALAPARAAASPRQELRRAAPKPGPSAPEEPRDAFGLIAAAVARGGAGGAERGAEAEPAAPAAAPAPARRTRRAHLAMAAFAALAVTATAAMMSGFAPGTAPSPAAAPTPPFAAAPGAEPVSAAAADASAPAAAPASIPKPVAAAAPSLETTAAASPARAAAAATPEASPAGGAFVAAARPQPASRLMPPEAPAPARAAPVALAALAGEGAGEAAVQSAFRSPAPRPRPVSAVSVAPSSGAAWVVIHHAPESRALAEALSVALTGDEFAHVTLREVGFDVSADHVRFYFAEDGARAGALAAALGGTLGSGFAVRDFSDFDDLPGRMTLEVWLAGGAG
ncbi:MAG: hypothetical protein ACE37J_12900 [Pikeienuella sp.]|uniref:hypothetical protein n=1 Tax=Pikeienuella sp. TaxID=2831957 RepID=UPI00391C6187